MKSYKRIGYEKARTVGEMLKLNVSQHVIAKALDIPTNTVYKISSGRSYSKITGIPYTPPAPKAAVMTPGNGRESSVRVDQNSIDSTLKELIGAIQTLTTLVEHFLDKATAPETTTESEAN